MSVLANSQVTETVLRCFLGVGSVDRLVLKLLTYVLNVIGHTCPASMDHALWAQQVCNCAACILPIILRVFLR